MTTDSRFDEVGPDLEADGQIPLLGPEISDDALATEDFETVNGDTMAELPDPAMQEERQPAEQMNDEPASAQVSEADSERGSTEYGDIWDRIRAGFGLPALDDSRVNYHERWFVKNPQYMDRKVERARLYLYHIVEEVEKRGMPMEIALLPAIESAYQPHAYSRARALGLWQFIAPTARRYGIQMNWWYDGRQDVLTSTRAALDYLEKLYAEFGNWHLALAAYNAGEGKIHYAMAYNQRRGRPTSYQYLRLRAETRHYVPKLIALSRIVANPDAYGVQIAPIPNQPYFAPVDIGSQIDLHVVAQLADIPMGDLYDINPGFKRWATAPQGPHRVLVPIDRKEQLIEALNDLPDEQRIKWRRHRVRKGDTLSTIARRYRVTVSAIKQANHIRGSLIRVKQNLMIPISARPLSRRVANVTRPAPRRRVTPPKSQAKVVHRVRRGETLWSIARRYQVYVNQLARWNYMNTRDILRVGQRLNIWIAP
jgi:membrane-bound lytic murein transglycosylase D